MVSSIRTQILIPLKHQEKVFKLQENKSFSIPIDFTLVDDEERSLVFLFNFIKREGLESLKLIFKNKHESSSPLNVCSYLNSDRLVVPIEDIHLKNKSISILTFSGENCDIEIMIKMLFIV